VVKEILDKLKIDHLKVVDGGAFQLDSIDPDDTCGLTDKKASKKALKKLSDELYDLQEVLYAQNKYAVLIVLQAMDTGGKDSTIRRVLGPINPQGIRVTSFKKPSEEEIARGYLWRIQQKVPRKGMIRVFNRSHYEDVLVVRVRNLAPAEEVEKRYRQINDFERYLTENRVVVLKFMLHISKEEQKERLLKRLNKKSKHWKFNSADLRERKIWPDYMEAFQIALSRCSPENAPWYVIPANKRWARDVIIARIIRDQLKALDLQYPPPEEGLDKIVIDS
jgi:PPK2 family polyphosphate:nucleotide phosphotransferase